MNFHAEHTTKEKTLKSLADQFPEARGVNLEPPLSRQIELFVTENFVPIIGVAVIGVCLWKYFKQGGDVHGLIALLVFGFLFAFE